MSSSTSPHIPELSNEIIGSIFEHIVLNPALAKDPNRGALEAACLVSRQFAYYGRRGLYKFIDVLSSRGAKHYLELCGGYSDMVAHIKRLDIGSKTGWDTEGGAQPLSALLDLLAENGDVHAVRVFFELPWDKWMPSLQLSLIKLLVTRPVDILELGLPCECFPFHIIAIPWLCKRFCISFFVPKGGSASSSGRPDICTVRGCSSEIAELGRSAKPRNKHLSAPLDSIWLEGDAIAAISSHLSAPGFTGPTEVSFTGITDSTFPSAIDFLEAYNDSIENIMLNIITVSTSNAPYLSRFANLALSRLGTLTLFIYADPIFQGKTLKSVAWLLLHLQKTKNFQLKKLNLIFVDKMNSIPSSNAMDAMLSSLEFQDRIFGTIDFFKFDSVISSILHPEGSVHLWLLLSQIPMMYQHIFLQRRIETSLPALHKDAKILGSVGQVTEVLKLADALSILPKEPFVSAFEAAKHIGPSEEKIYDDYPKLRPGQSVNWQELYQGMRSYQFRQLFG